jgi:hypothetical protein
MVGNMNSSIEIPFFIEKRRIIVFANINGINGKFLWDTGATVSLINNNIKNFTFDKYVECQYAISNYSIKQKFYKINEIKLGGEIIKNKSLIGKTPAIIKKTALNPTKSDGILGLYAFTGYWCELSFSKQKIILYKKKPEEYFQRTKLKRTYMGLRINSTISGKKYELEIDTGYPYSIEIDNHYNNKKNSIKIFSSRDYNGFYFKTPSFFKLFNNRFTNCYITNTNTKKNYGLIGIEYLKHYDILFDLTEISNDKKYLYYKKASDFLYLHNFIFPQKINNNTITEFWTYENGIKLDLNKKNILTKYGITQDTLIVEINGILIKNYNLDNLKKQQFSKDIYELTIKEGAIRKKIKI